MFGGNSAGDYRQDTPLDDLWRYSIHENSWTKLPSCPQARVSSTMICYRNSLYVIGSQEKKDRNIVWRYDIARREWNDEKEINNQLLKQFPSNHLLRHSATLIESRVFIYGGFQISGNRATSILLSIDLEKRLVIKHRYAYFANPLNPVTRVYFLFSILAMDRM